MSQATSDLNYTELLGKAREITVLNSAEGVIHWDMETKMPPKGIELRSQQLALLGRIEHKMCTDPGIETLIEKIEGHGYGSLDELQKRNVYLIKKNFCEMTALPEKLVSELIRQGTITTDTWKKAKAARSFANFKPDLEKLVDLEREAAQILMDVKGTKTPYDALIDIFEPKMTAEQISRIFDELKRGLVSIIKKCGAAPNQPDTSFLCREVPIDAQRKISNSLAKFIGYDVESKEACGRIDETEHPFTTGYYDDVRITTHYHERNFASSAFSVLHEGGHATYEKNLRREWIYQPIGAACSYGFHESQSRFVENIVGRSREFWAYFLPILKGFTGDLFSDIPIDRFVHAINRVEPSKVRIEADEVTYCLHIIIRFEIERELFAGKITVSDLPEIWNQKYKEYLGVKIENDAEGVMQDTHWASGLYGYFPSYALGNIYSGQILSIMQKEVPDWRGQIAKGDFCPVKSWLTEKIYNYGNLYDPGSLIKKISGEGINAKHYLDYLDEKYSGLYGY